MSSLLPTQPQTRDQASTVMLRRRDKRRHLSASAFDLRDPLELLSLAIRFDESHENEALLRTPLESGSLYDMQQFVDVFQFLLEKTKPSLKLSRHSPYVENDRPVAVTPIMLSGVIATLQKYREMSGKDPYSMSESSELVNACQTRRHAALSRLRIKKKRRRAQRVIIPVFCVVILLVIYARGLMEMSQLVL